MRIQLVFLLLVVWTSIPSSAAAQPAWLYGNGPREIFRIDPRTGVTTLIGQLGRGLRVMTDIAVTPDGTIYAISDDSLMRLDLTSGLTVRIGSLNVAGEANALASDRLGRLFGATEEGTFFEVDPATGAARVVGAFGGGHRSEGDLAFAPDGRLFATSAINRLLRIDIATGQATEIGNTTYEQLEGLAFDADGRLYASTARAEFISVDPSTAESLPAGVFNNGQHMDGLAIIPLVNLRSATSGLTVTLAWERLGSTLSYVLEAGSAPGLRDLYNADIGDVTTLTASAATGTYFVRLRPRTASGIGFPSNEVQVTLGPPSCVSPSPPTGFSESVTRNILTLQWNAAPGAATYILEAGTSPGLANMYAGNVGSGTTLTFNLASAPRILYYLRLRSVASCGITSVPVELVLNRR